MTDETAPLRILTVCLGNYCRSPFAATVLATRGGPALTVRSAGLLASWEGKPAHPFMIAAAARRGYDLTAHRGVRVSAELLDWADLVLAMDTAVLDALRDLAGAGNAPKLRLYLEGVDVPDPMGRPEGAFTACAAVIESGADRYLPRPPD
ncbi:low molecular weight protein-tyrosine-phosphatase [Kitasatospora cystarginea]|uniref:protein-tyrosine-phosphatase n=1 Tax=Kitasatospora cystarginea TaxID=58350 RepID=A0ABP5RM28_9ACTN